MPLSTIEEAWHTARMLHDLPDTKDAMLGFYYGARFVISASACAYDADDTRDYLLTVNDEVQQFGRKALALETTP